METLQLMTRMVRLGEHCIYAVHLANGSLGLSKVSAENQELMKTELHRPGDATGRSFGDELTGFCC